MPYEDTETQGRQPGDRDRDLSAVSISQRARICRKAPEPRETRKDPPLEPSERK